MLEFIQTIGQILPINILLSGDNAIVIAMASRNLPEHLPGTRYSLGNVRRNRTSDSLCIYYDLPAAASFYPINRRMSPIVCSI